jgi:predicted dehydrogenase
VEIVGMTDPDIERGIKFEKEHGVQFYTDVNKLLDIKIDFVVVCSENYMHAPYTIAAASRGYHVITEKPISTNRKDSQEMIEACKKNNVLLMVCFPVRYSAPIIKAKEAIVAGEIGDLVSIVSTNHGQMPGGWFVEPELSGGGCVIDHTVHCADIMNWVMQGIHGREIAVKDVKAVYSRMIHDIPTEDVGMVLFEFENGVTASIDTSWNRPKSFPVWGDLVMDFIGTKGSLRVDAMLERGVIYSDTMQKAGFLGFGNNMDHDMVLDFLDKIRNGASVSPVSGEDGHFAMDIALKAYGR